MCLTIQTVFMVLFLSTVIIKLVSDELVQLLAPRLGDGTQQDFFQAREYVVCGPYECISGILDLRVNPSSPGLCFYDDKIKAHHHSQFILDLTHLIDIC